jgi:RNA polymerase sigma-70 factor (ECF subfamily)
MPVAEPIAPLSPPDSLAALPDDRASSPDIAVLTARMTRGDEAAWRQFYEIYFSRLLRYLLVLVRGHEEAAREAVQLTLLRVVKHVRKFDSEEAFWSWLTVLARSSVVDEQRKRTRYLAALDRFIHRNEVANSMTNTDADAHLLKLLDTHVAGLESDERDLVRRKYFEGESIKAIAAGLEATEKAIDSRLVRVRRKLKESILTQLRDESA